MPSKLKQTSAERRFVDEANPNQWLLVADNLHCQAVEVRGRFGKSIEAQTDGANVLIGEWDGANRSAFLLAGFALENALKAFLVYENSSWISNGRLSGKLRSHNLVELKNQSRCVPYKRESIAVLRRFEDGLETWARYPCSLDASVPIVQVQMTDDDWDKYLHLMAAYGRRLTKLLSEKIWNGPHGFKARWSYHGEHLGAHITR